MRRVDDARVDALIKRYADPIDARIRQLQEIGFAPEMPVLAFEAYLNVAVPAHFPASTTYVKLPYDTLAQDNTGAFSLANDQFTVPSPGVWHFEASLFTSTALAANTVMTFGLFSGGVEIKRFQYLASAVGAHTLHGSVTMQLAAGTVLEVRGAISGAVTKTAGAGVAYAYWHGTRLGS